MATVPSVSFTSGSGCSSAQAKLTPSMVMVGSPTLPIRSRDVPSTRIQVSEPSMKLLRSVRPVPRRSRSAFSPGLPSTVMLEMVGFAIGVALSSPSRLSASMALSAEPVCSMYRYCRLPVQPSVQSRESSALPVRATYLALTVPPKNSIPSSRLLCTWM